MSLFLPDLNALFVHVPHTGGTWVKETLEASGIRVQAAKGAGTHNVPEAYSDVGFRFCLVRHPIGMYESLWRRMRANWPALKDEPTLFRERAWSPTRFVARTVMRVNFDDFLRAVLVEQSGFVSRLYEAYVGFPGVAKVDAVGRMEGLPQHLRAILRHLGWRGLLANVPRANVSEGVLPTWDCGLRKDVLASEAPAIDRFYGGCADPPGAFGVEPDFVETW